MTSKLVSAVALLFNILPFQAQALDAEIALSIPVETNLAVPGIRSTQTVWIEMINSAKSTIDLEEFYIDNKPGEALEPVLNALKSAATRGVQVRFLVDLKFYNMSYSAEPNQLAQIPNVTVKTIDFSSYGGVQHAKYFVVDQAQAFVGSANFDWLALAHIHEVGLRMNDGPTAASLELVFNKDWASGSQVGSKTFNSTSIAAPAPEVQTTSTTVADFLVTASPPVANPAGVEDTLSHLIALMNLAKTSIKIQNYQYNTKGSGNSGRWTDLDSAIRKAAARGVHVQLCLDKAAAKVGQADIQALQALPNIEVKMISIPQWSGGPLQFARLIHSKYMIVDDAQAWVGSENWNSGYFSNTRNVGVILQDSALVGSIKQIFMQVWTSGY